MKRAFWSLLFVTALTYQGVVPIAEAGPWDVEVEVTVNPNEVETVTVTFTKNGMQIGGVTEQFINGTNMVMKEKFKATAPAGTNDRRYRSEAGSLVALGSTELPPGQVADYGDFLFANGFVGLASALDSPIAIGDQNTNGMWDGSDVSIFARLDDISAFSAFANETLFPLETTLMTNSSGEVSGLPGLEFFRDASFTMPYSNSQLLVVGISREFSTVPEPSTLLLLGTGLAGLLGYGWSRQQRRTAKGIESRCETTA